MTTTEMSAQFDTLFNNITSNQAPGLDEYEKSVFLTKGQDEVIKNYFSPKGNPKQDGFDDSPKRQHDFSTLVQTKDLDPLVETSVSGGVGVFDHRGLDYKYESDIFLVLNEQLYNKATNFIYTINPISFDEYNRLMQKPYKYPPKNQVWRLMIANNVEAHQETITEIEDAPGEADIELSDEAVEAFKYDSENYWEETKVHCEMKVAKAFTIKIVATPGNPPSVEDYLTYFSPTITSDTITIYRPSASTSSWPLSRIYSTLGTEPTLPIWNYIESIQMPEEDNFMSNQVNSYCEPGNTVLLYEGYIPVSQEEVTKTITIPASTARISELIGRWYGNTDNLVYRVRYVKRPQPIILVDLDTDNVEDGLGFEYAGQILTSETPCELPESLHSEVLQRAVELAKIAWQGETQAIVTSGQRSE